MAVNKLKMMVLVATMGAHSSAFAAAALSR
jgi:hypothetical protein